MTINVYVHGTASTAVLPTMLGKTFIVIYTPNRGLSHYRSHFGGPIFHRRGTTIYTFSRQDSKNRVDFVMKTTVTTGKNVCSASTKISTLLYR